MQFRTAKVTQLSTHTLRFNRLRAMRTLTQHCTDVKLVDAYLSDVDSYSDYDVYKSVQELTEDFDLWRQMSTETV